MGPARPAIALRVSFLLVLTIAGSVTWLGAQRPPASALVYPNDCPHEPPCADSVWVAHERLPACARLNDRSRRAFIITRGQRIRFHRAFIVVDRPGRVVVSQAQSRFRDGDTLYVLGYEGEGEYRVWHRDTVMALDPSALAGDVRRLARPRFTWWVEVSAGTGRRGWLALRNTADEGISFDEQLEFRPRDATGRAPAEPR
jgi:hypothetical protein